MGILISSRDILGAQDITSKEKFYATFHDLDEFDSYCKKMNYTWEVDGTGKIVLIDKYGNTTKTDVEIGTVLPDYFKLTALSAGTIEISVPNTGKPFVTSIKYSRDGRSFTEIDHFMYRSEVVELQQGDVIYLKGEATQWANSLLCGGLFHTQDCDVAVSGNIMSLIYGDDFVGQTTFPTNSSHNFENFFGDLGDHLLDAGELVLPATTLTPYCYHAMFFGCRNLVNPPALPATTLAEHCYEGMFQNCIRMTSAPELPATVIPERAYDAMFYLCESLTECPDLSHIVETGTDALMNMFTYCTSLVNGPVLTMSTISSGALTQICAGCTSLTSLTCLATTITSGANIEWLDDVETVGVLTISPNSRISDADYNLPATWSISGRAQTATPTITATPGDASYTVTAAGNGTVVLYADGVIVANPYTAVRGNADQTIVFTATAQEAGTLISDTATQTILIPALPVTATPTITANEDAAECVVTATGNGTIILYKDGTQVATGTGTASATYQRGNSDVTSTFTATAQEANKQVSAAAEQSVTIHALPVTATPTITAVEGAADVTVTAAGDGTVILYLNDAPVANPYVATRGNTVQILNFTATAQETNKQISLPAQQSVTVDALPVSATPVITATKRDTDYLIEVTSSSQDATITVTSDGEPMANPFTVVRGNSDGYFSVTATATEPNHQPNTVTQSILIEALPVTATPTITYDDSTFTVSVSGDGVVKGYIDGVETQMPHTFTQDDTTHIYAITATAQETNKQISAVASLNVTVPALVTATPTISYDSSTFTVTATGSGTVVLSVDGSQVDSGTGSASHTFTQGATAVTYAVSATAQEQGKAISTAATDSITVPAAVTATPTITAVEGSTDVTVTAAGNGTIVLYADGVQVATGTGTATDTVTKGSTAQTIVFTATAQETGKAISATASETVIVPAAAPAEIPNYMKLEILDEPGNDGNVNINIPFNSGSISYSKDGANWTDTTVDHAMTITIPVEAGDTVYLKGINQIGLNNGYGFGIINATVDHNVSGNIMSLIYGDNFATQTTLPMNMAGGVFSYLFSGETENRANTRLKSAANLILPATTLLNSVYCYRGMFRNCSNLTAAPALPATVLETGCYEGMFVGCTSLTAAPALPATTLAQYCYNMMFYGCTSLTAAPALPATSLAQNCYSQMFQGCTSLTAAPALPATSLAQNCYRSMFGGCTSLISAPALPATSLAQNCYQSMFYQCTSLTSAPALPATTLQTNCYDSMFYGCTALTAAPTLPATLLVGSCYQSMFRQCTSLTSVECKAISMNDQWAASLNYWLNNINTTGTLTVPANTQIADADWNKPANWTLVKDYSGMPLTLKVMSASEIEDATGDDSFTDGDPADIMVNIPSYVDDSLATSLSYSTDGGTTWTTEAVDNTDQQITISTEIGGTVLLKGIANQWCPDEMLHEEEEEGEPVTIEGPGLQIGGDYLIVEGNVMSLIYGDNFANQTSFPANTSTNLAGIFYECQLYDASNLVLPATSLTDHCYRAMFNGCTAMVSGPAILPATTLAYNCYQEMFNTCNTMENAPEIMATATDDGSEITGMFMSCDALNEVRCHIEDGTIEPSWLEGCAVDTAEEDPETGDLVVTDFTLYVPTDTQINDEDWYVPTGGIISKTL